MSAPLETLSRPSQTPLSEPLKLYSTEYCGYCWHVREAAERLGIKLMIEDVGTDRAARARLMSGTGRTRVPVLEIKRGEHVQFLPESRDIISYLQRLPR